MKILANDGISNSGVKKLEESGFEVITTNVAQEQLENYKGQVFAKKKKESNSRQT